MSPPNYSFITAIQTINRYLLISKAIMHVSSEVVLILVIYYSFTENHHEHPLTQVFQEF